MKKVLVTGADGFIGSHLTESFTAVSICRYRSSDRLIHLDQDSLQEL